MFSIADEICTRLLDHRCFTSGELRYFVKQFEEIRNNREQVQVDKIGNNVNEIIETDIPTMKTKLSEKNLPKVEEKIDELLELTKELIDLEFIEEKRRRRKLAEKIIVYEGEKSKVIKETQAKIKEEDEIFFNKAADLRKYYKELEAKWKIDTSD